jgi:hypothetical protein
MILFISQGWETVVTVSIIVCYHYNSYVKTAESVWWVSNNLHDRGIVFRFPAAVRDRVLFSTSTRPAVGPTQPPIQWYRELFPDVNRPGPETDHLFPSVTEVKNSWNYASTLRYDFVAWYLIKHTDNLALTYPTPLLVLPSFRSISLSSFLWTDRRGRME